MRRINFNEGGRFFTFYRSPAIIRVYLLGFELYKVRVGSFATKWVFRRFR